MEILNDIRLETRNDYINTVKKLIYPFYDLYNEKKSVIILPNEIAVSYSNETMRFESFSRSLIGYSLIDLEENTIIKIFKMISNGTSPDSNYFWGNINDNDQKIVELFPILFFCFRNKNIFFKYFSLEEKRNIANWFLQINEVSVPKNNWQFFIILVNILLKKLEIHSNIKDNSEIAFKEINKMYKGNGWYTDGMTSQCDYYIPFAMHFYSLLYLFIEPNDIRKEIIINRANEFAKDFIYFFSSTGKAIPFGRSLTYKFAQVAFFSIFSIFENSLERLSIYKGIINRNLRWWLNQSIFTDKGFLINGYSYYNPYMTEFYNATGSPYWALKSFFLLISENNKIFQVKEKEYPETENVKHIPNAYISICKFKSNSLLFMNGQKSKNEFGNVESKYEKFLYTTIVGPCISRSLYGLNNISPDNTLCVKIGNSFIVRKNIIPCKSTNPNIKISKWEVIPGIIIKSIICIGAPYHLRTHIIECENHEFELLDLGMAIPFSNNSTLTSTSNNIALASTKLETCCIMPFLDNGISEICFSSPNVNVEYKKVVIPYVNSKINRGTNIIMNVCYIDVDNNFNYQECLDMIKITNKSISFQGNSFNINTKKSIINYSNIESQIIQNLKRLKKIYHNLWR